jgi:hypothetical protein
VFTTDDLVEMTIPDGSTDEISAAADAAAQRLVGRELAQRVS